MYIHVYAAAVPPRNLGHERRTQARIVFIIELYLLIMREIRLRCIRRVSFLVQFSLMVYNVMRGHITFDTRGALERSVRLLYGENNWELV